MVEKIRVKGYWKKLKSGHMVEVKPSIRKLKYKSKVVSDFRKRK